MVFQREDQRISASEVLQAIASGEEIVLRQCVVTGKFDLNRLFVDEENFDISKLDVVSDDDKRTVTLAQPLKFNLCTFEDNVCFAPPWEKPEQLEVLFKQDVIFNSSVFLSQARFSRTTFFGVAAFDGCRFEAIASFRKASYRALAKFRTVVFNGYGLFDGSVFQDEVGFTNTCFSRGGNFTNVRFENRTDFSGVYSQSKSVPVYESVQFTRHQYGDDETFWRFIKQASQDAGHYQLAGESFYRERCAHLWRRLHGPDYDKLSVMGKLGRMVLGLRLSPELIFGRLLFGYGERPMRVLLVSMLIILACALFYSSSYAVLLDRVDLGARRQYFMDGLYFSTITFTTLGFGDMYPAPKHLVTRCVAMFEAISGACLMALFVVSLAKRYSRG